MSLVKVIINIKKDQLTISYKRHLGLNSEGSSVFSGNSVIVFRNQSFLSKKKTHQFFRCYVCADEVQSDALIWSDLEQEAAVSLCLLFPWEPSLFPWSLKLQVPSASCRPARRRALFETSGRHQRHSVTRGKKKKKHQPNLFNQTQEEHVWGVARRHLACSKFGQMRWRWANEDLHTSQSSQQI